jgi:5-methyltetrahydropteroyltriglutamate--homocysteine methyltransferase
VSHFFRNDYYSSQDAYLEAIADAMRPEYEAIVAGGFEVQIDCPEALANIQPERARIHICWGNYERPHHRDVPLGDIIDIVFSERPSFVCFEAAILPWLGSV